MDYPSTSTSGTRENPIEISDDEGSERPRKRPRCELARPVEYGDIWPELEDVPELGPQRIYLPDPPQEEEMIPMDIGDNDDVQLLLDPDDFELDAEPEWWMGQKQVER